MSAALTSRVAWDRVLRQVSLVLPEDVWLTSLSATAPSPATAAGAATASGFTLIGSTYSQNGVARFLSRLAVIPDLENVRLQSSESVLVNERQLVQFTILADVRGPGDPRGRCGLVKGKLDTRTLSVLAGICILLYGAAGYFLVVSPKKGEAIRLDEQIAATSVELAAARAAAEAQDDTQPIAVADIFRLATAMPSSPDMPGILLELSRIAEETGIRFKSISPQSALVDRRVRVGADRRDLRRLVLCPLGLPLPPAHARLGAARRAARGRASLLRRDRQLLGGRNGLSEARCGTEAPGLRLRQPASQAPRFRRRPTPPRHRPRPREPRRRPQPPRRTPAQERRADGRQARRSGEGQRRPSRRRSPSASSFCSSPCSRSRARRC